MHRVWTSRALAAAIVAGSALGLTACSSSEQPSPGGNAQASSSLPAGAASCADDPRVDAYASKMTRDGSLGTLKFRLDESSPAPPAKGQNSFSLQLLDAKGKLANGELTVNLTMPDHGHGTSVVPQVSFDADTQTFTVDPLYLFMAGVWRIDFSAYASASDPDTLLDSTSFYFCIEG